MHADLCGNKSAGTGRGIQIESALNFPVGSSHDSSYLRYIHIRRQVFNIEFTLKQSEKEKNSYKPFTFDYAKSLANETRQLQIKEIKV